jgi:hypothetical protein
VGEADRGRHEDVRLVGRIAEHQALIAGALFALVLAIDALRDIRGLLADDVDDAAARAVETHVRMVVADIEYGLAHQRLDIHPGARRDLARHDDDAGLDQGLAGDPAARVGRDDRIEHGVRNLVSHLVGMALGNGFGGKGKTVAHNVKYLQVLGRNSRCSAATALHA